MRSSLVIALLSISSIAPSVAFAQAPNKPADKAQTAKPADKPADKPKPRKTPAKPDPNAPTTDAASGANAPMAPPDLAPPPPPPWTSTTPLATSTSGTQLMPTTPSVAPAAAATPDSNDEKITRDNRFAMLEARLAADEKVDKENAEALSWLRHFKLTGYIQPQLIWQHFNTAASPNLSSTGTLPSGVGANSTLTKADGSTTNPDLFRLRRARVKFEYMPTDYARFIMELDPSLAGGSSAGTGTIARNVEAQGIVHWIDNVTTTFGMGIFKIPFGFEVLQNDADRPFIERSWGEQNMTPAEFDTGAKAYTTIKEHRGGLGGNDGTLNFQVAVINGQTIGEKNFAIVPDLNRGKDIVGRVNYDFGDWVDIGVSGYVGQGQNIDAATLRFKQFSREAFNAELGLHHEWKKGFTTKLFGEFTLGSNMDRGVKYGFALPAIPTNVTSDVTSLSERNVWGRFEQDITEWVTVGARYDVYIPDTSVTNNARSTTSVVAAIHFTKGLQWMNEYDYAIDNVHKSGGTAPSKHIETFSSVLQVRF